MHDLLLKIWCAASNRFAQLNDDESGATAVEYALMVALIATVVIALVVAIGDKTRLSFRSVRVNLP
jgi:Flp pilus assembly pilin Flp